MSYRFKEGDAVMIRHLVEPSLQGYVGARGVVRDRNTGMDFVSVDLEDGTTDFWVREMNLRMVERAP